MMVEKGCESGKKWQEHCYGEHMDPDVGKIRFFKLMIGDFTKGISIPDKFAKKFDGIESLDLKARGSETWKVGIDKHATKLFLMSGWEDFVMAHRLQQGDLLIFTCSGNSLLHVLIFEPSGCEKVSSLLGNRTGPDMCKHVDDMVDQGQQSKHDSLSDSDETTTPSQPVGSSLYNASTSMKLVGSNRRQLHGSPESSNDHVKNKAIGEEGSNEQNANSKYYYSRIANRLSNKEKEKVISLVSTRPYSPVFVTVLQMSHVRRRSNFLIFSSQFAADHLDSRLNEITLVRPNRKDKWCVKYYHKRDCRGIRNHNFYKFVQDNRLCEGDICAFELMKGTRKVTVMTVHAVRKVAGRFVPVR